MDEQSLIARAQRGDLQAYDALVRQYEQRAFRALGSFKLGQPFRPWLMRIVTNLALNRVEATQRRTRMTERYTQEVIVSADNPSPERELAKREQSERLLQAVGQLTPAEQTLISLRYFLELPETEVAEALNVPKGTIKSRLHRTLARLREIISKEYPDLQELTLVNG